MMSDKFYDLGNGYSFHLDGNEEIDSICYKEKQLFTIQQLAAITKWNDFVKECREERSSSSFAKVFDSFFDTNRG